MMGKQWDRLLKLGIAGTAVTCVACFTPAAVALLALLGLAEWAGYLDYVLFPLLGFFLMLLGYGYWQRRPRERAWHEGDQACTVSRSPGGRLAGCGDLGKGGSMSRPSVRIYSTPT